MGRVNFDHKMYDKKGITENVTLNGEKKLIKNWKIYNINLTNVENLNTTTSLDPNLPGAFFKY